MCAVDGGIESEFETGPDVPVFFDSVCEGGEYGTQLLANGSTRCGCIGNRLCDCIIPVVDESLCEVLMSFSHTSSHSKRAMTIIDIPTAFTDAFIAYADEKNDSDDELNIDVSADGRTLHVCTVGPVQTAIRLTTGDGDTVTAEIGTVELVFGPGGEVEENWYEVGTVEITLADPVHAAQHAVECWIQTL